MDENMISLHVAEELKRMLERQKQLDPATQEYCQLLTNIEILGHTCDLYVDIESYIAAAGLVDGITKVELAPGLVDLLKEQESKIVELHPDPEEGTFLGAEAGEESQEEPVHEPVDEAAQVSYDLVTVREALKNAKKRGVDIKALIQSFGATNLTDLPEEKYGELMMKLED